MAATVDASEPSGHVLLELGLGVEWVGDELHGGAPIVPEMHVPGTDVLRISVLAAWLDTVAGLLVADVVWPRVPVTLELDVHLATPPRQLEWVRLRGRLAKVGRTVVVPTVELLDGDGRSLGFGAASFMVAPDPELRMPDRTSLHGRPPGMERLREPLAARVGIEHRERGVVALPRTDEVLNASRTVNGGLLALAVEEAVRSLDPGTTLGSLAMRYLQPVRVGPAVATAELQGRLGRVEVHDAGAGGRCAVLATTRFS